MNAEAPFYFSEDKLCAFCRTSCRVWMSSCLTMCSEVPPWPQSMLRLTLHPRHWRYALSHHISAPVRLRPAQDIL